MPRDRDGVRPEPRRVVGDADPCRSAWIRVPTGGAALSVGSRTSIAPEASWTTIRRPVESSRVAGVVTTASMATSRSVIRERAGDRHGRRRPAARGRSVPGRHGAWRDGDGPAAVATRSAVSRTQIR